MCRDARTVTLTVLGALAIAHCEPGAGGGGGPGTTAGSMCSAADHDANLKACSGTKVLECAPAGPDFAWAVSEDCADKGTTCIGHAACDTPAGVPDAGATPSENGATGSWKGTCEGTTIQGGFSMTLDGKGNVAGTLTGSSSATLSGNLSGNSLYAQAKGDVMDSCMWTGTLEKSGASQSGSGTYSCPSGCSGTWSTTL